MLKDQVENQSKQLLLQQEANQTSKQNEDAKLVSDLIDKAAKNDPVGPDAALLALPSFYQSHDYVFAPQITGIINRILRANQQIYNETVALKHNEIEEKKALEKEKRRESVIASAKLTLGMIIQALPDNKKNKKSPFHLTRKWGNADLSGANLSSADLSGANLSSANLFNANLSSTDLNAANLIRADLIHANLMGADLSFTNLEECNLIDADLSEAIIASVEDFVRIKAEVHKDSRKWLGQWEVREHQEDDRTVYRLHEKEEEQDTSTPS